MDDSNTILTTQSSSPTRQEQLSALMDYACHFIHNYLGKRRGQGRILRLLNKNGSMTQLDLQNQLCVQSGSVSEILAKMESADLIKRERDSSDKRRVIVSITDAGLNELCQYETLRLRRQAVLYDGLTAEEQENLICILQRLQENWEKLPPGRQNAPCCKDKGGVRP